MRSTGAAPRVPAVSWSDFVALEDGDRRELIDGRLEEAEEPTKWHENLVALLAYFLQGWARTRKLRVLASGFRLRVGANRGALPDLQILKESVYRSRANDQGLARGRPELVLEIVSPSSRRHDRVRKVQWYASLGIPEYWIVDVDDRMVQRLRLKGRQYLLAQQAAEDEVFRPASMEGLEIPLAELWSALTPPRARRRRSPR